MSIELRENEWAEQMIASHSLGSNLYQTISCIARYYLDQKYTKEETKTKLDSFMVLCDSGMAPYERSVLIDKVVKDASRRAAVYIEYIGISQTELNTIAGLTGKPIKRLAFTLLCLAKYRTAVNPLNDYWTSTKESEIMAMANIKTSIKRQCAMYNQLWENGLIQFSKKVDSTNKRVCFVDNCEPVLRITDFRNLGYQYLMYNGEPYFECTNCGIVTKINHPDNRRNQKYCPECASKILTKQRVEALARYRNSESSSRNNHKVLK